MTKISTTMSDNLGMLPEELNDRKIILLFAKYFFAQRSENTQ